MCLYVSVYLYVGAYLSGTVLIYSVYTAEMQCRSREYITVQMKCFENIHMEGTATFKTRDKIHTQSFLANICKEIQKVMLD